MTDGIVHAFTAIVTALLAWHALRFVQDAYAFGDTVIGDWPAWVFQLIMPVGFAAISYRYTLRALRALRGAKP